MTTPLAFAHIGDLHLTRAEADNARDFSAIVAQIDETEGSTSCSCPGTTPTTAS